MNDTTPLPTDWFQYYQQTTAPATPAIAAGGHSNTTSTIVTTSFTTNNNISTPTNSTTSIVSETYTHLNPQATSAKPIRRRPRNSRRTPTTLLNASTANFRSLVQKFTGCHNTKTSLNFQKGPVNLSFGKSRSQNIELGTSSRVVPFGFGYYNQQPTNDPALLQHQQHQEMLYPKQHENMKSSTLDDFVIDDISLHELVDESSFNGSRKDGYYF